MKILQLCCFTNFWGDEFEIENIDMKFGKDVFDLELHYGKNFDLVLAAPPCDQFTKANNKNWIDFPKNEIDLVKRCLKICEQSGKRFILENPPGRIEKFIPELTKYRVLNFRDFEYNKEYILYSNILLLMPYVKRYGKKTIPRKKEKREEWTKGLIELFKMNLK
jgi:site-specific DNA-cytosine methylase